MTQLRKKGTEGTAVEYVTRNRAIKNLQIGLTDFRRLCILKGIYPRDPKHKNKVGKGTGTNKKTVYLAKDIQFLAHEPLLRKFREQKSFYKRLSKYVAKRDWTKIDSLKRNVKPVISLDHLIRERYPRFEDALADLDDAISMIALFATLPRTGASAHQAETGVQCAQLMRQFEAYIIATGSLKKTFISIKGIYYQANVLGHDITWIVPHEFSTRIPTDVDFKVMLTFLEFYMTLMRFVNFRLFTRLGWEFAVDGDAITWINSHEECLLTGTFPEIKDKEELFPSGDERLLKDQLVYVSREVSLKSASFILQAMGARISFAKLDGSEDSLLVKEDDPTITMQIVDRPMLSKMFTERKYVQPQWVFDSLNKGELLDFTGYGIGEQLPPHLSPFHPDEDEQDDVESAEEDAEEAQVDEEDARHNATKKDKKQLAISMLSKKRKKLYEKMQYSRQKKADAKERLAAKRKTNK